MYVPIESTFIESLYFFTFRAYFLQNVTKFQMLLLALSSLVSLAQCNIIQEIEEYQSLDDPYDSTSPYER